MSQNLNFEHTNNPLVVISQECGLVKTNKCLNLATNKADGVLCHNFYHTNCDVQFSPDFSA